MPVKTNASCTSIPDNQNDSGTMLLELSAGGTYFFQCDFFETQNNFVGIVRYQNVDDAGSSWVDISTQTGEGIFLKDTAVESLQSDSGSSYEFMTSEDFNILWPSMVGLLVAGYIVKRLLAAF